MRGQAFVLRYADVSTYVYLLSTFFVDIRLLVNSDHAAICAADAGSDRGRRVKRCMRFARLYTSAFLYDPYLNELGDGLQ